MKSFEYYGVRFNLNKKRTGFCPNSERFIYYNFYPKENLYLVANVCIDKINKIEVVLVDSICFCSYLTGPIEREIYSNQVDYSIDKKDIFFGCNDYDIAKHKQEYFQYLK